MQKINVYTYSHSAYRHYRPSLVLDLVRFFEFDECILLITVCFVDF